MTDRRRASTPPEIPGYTCTRLLGLGGFADVFLYHQQLPSRDVAVKVLIAPGMDTQLRERFVTEANLMAQLSHHPAIVTVYQAGFADDGRPYLVMEYCSRPPLAERYRAEQMSVAECLRIGVRLASAVQTAHDAGILHRDIKPANVLTTDFGWPALTDFGIAATTHAGDGVAAVGMSIPWAPPELLRPRPAGDERSDVYSLAATVYSLLAGRSPFEVAGTANTAADLVARIERMRLPAVGRQDVPAELTDVLERAMAKVPEQRHGSATTFARALQAVEASLSLPVTPLDLAQEVPATPAATTPAATVRDEPTRSRAVVEPHPTAPTTGADDLGATLHRSVLPVPDAPAAPAPGPVPPHPPTSAPRRRGRGVAVAVVLLAVLVVALALAHRPVVGAPPSGGGTDYQPPAATPGGVVPAPTSVVGTVQADGTVRFTWTNPDPRGGDTYVWARLSLTGDPQLAPVPQPTVLLPAATGQVCIEVLIVRADGRTSSQAARGCTP